MSAIEGGNSSRALSARLADLERRQDLLRTRLSEAPVPVVRLHPRLAEVYAEKVQQLEAALNDPAIRIEAGDVLRSLVDHIELTPSSTGLGLDAKLYGDLAQILSLCGEGDGIKKSPKTGTSGSQLSVVAGARNHLDLQLNELLAAVLET